MEKLPTLDDVAEWTSSGGPGWDALAELEVVDGLPVEPITVDDVTSALHFAHLGADEIVTVVPPMMRPAPASAVAICALLAGCEPQTFPVVVAAVRGIAEPSFNGIGVLTTTGTAAVAVIVSGEAARAFNSGPNLLGPGVRANATVGRAVSLVCRVVGGALPGIGDMSTMGQPGKYTFCFAETDQSPWEPLHVAMGVDAPSAVTVFAASGTTEVTNAYITSAGDVLDTLAAGLFAPGTINFDHGTTGGGRYVVIVSPDWAAMLGEAGLTRASLCSELASRATWPASILPDGLRRPLLELRSGAVDSETLRAVESPTDLLIVVGGG